MNATIKLYDVKTMTHAEWKKSRNSGLGGSDVAAICGLNPWRSPLSVYLEKTGQIDGAEENEAMEWGTALEPIIAKKFEERTELKVRTNNYILQHPQYPFMLANLDREIVGKKEGLEIKTTSAWNGGKMHKEIPDYYYLQCLHYMAVTGYIGWYLAILVGGNQMHIHYIPRDEEDIQNLIKIESDFWNNHVLAKVMPEANHQDSDVIRALVGDVKADKEIYLSGENVSDYIQQFKIAKQTIKDAEKLKNNAANNIKLLMGDASIGLIDNYIVMNKPIVSNKFNTKGFIEDHKDLADQYKIESVSTRFEIKEEK